MADIFIDATNAIVGRIGAHAAKRALLGDTVKIFNCENAIMSGSKVQVTQRYYERRNKIGQPQKGPFISRMPDRFFRRTIRGMLPYKRTKGAAAYKRIMCYIGVPEQFKDKKLQLIAGTDAGKLKSLKRITVGEVCKKI
ncbi:50S ribosomal protein L13 [Candidatus Woesearchaeota archaeon]|nr:50S ribosomal protein L13 [Candidatus Woesearchaeota archaeon]MBW2994448.1 50S ribosomal protein L13 [Candidatus Woesearchaeota archaeon]